MLPLKGHFRSGRGVNVSMNPCRNMLMQYSTRKKRQVGNDDPRLCGFLQHLAAISPFCMGVRGAPQDEEVDCDWFARLPETENWCCDREHFGK